MIVGFCQIKIQCNTITRTELGYGYFKNQNSSNRTLENFR